MKTRYHHETPLDLHTMPDTPLPAQSPLPPVVRHVYHGDTCSCESCCDLRAAMDLYLRARKNWHENGF
jgi:hypothetical protein